MARSKYAMPQGVLAHLSVEEGLQLISARDGRPRKIMGQTIQHDTKRFRILESCPLKCFNCGCEATHFLVANTRQHRRYQINAFSRNRMLTWDHIIPKSFGGSDHVSNARIACSVCNSKRGNRMSLSELLALNTRDIATMYKPQGRPWASSLTQICQQAQHLANTVHSVKTTWGSY